MKIMKMDLNGGWSASVTDNNLWNPKIPEYMIKEESFSKGSG